ncbi:zinc ribbon domain-containing protein [Streptomyces sp. NPDC002536]
MSIWTTVGRIKNIRFVCSADALKTLRAYRKGESDLIARDGAFYLIAVCDVPAHTSQQCSGCGHTDKKNRASQGLFICRNCGVVAHADRNASRNLARKGAAAWNAGRESRVPATP